MNFFIILITILLNYKKFLEGRCEMKKITYKKFYEVFIEPYLIKGDKPHNRQLWNDTLDYCLKDKTLPYNADVWVYPNTKYFE